MTSTQRVSPYVYIAGAGLGLWLMARWVVILGI